MSTNDQRNWTPAKGVNRYSQSNKEQNNEFTEGIIGSFSLGSFITVKPIEQGKIYKSGIRVSPIITSEVNLITNALIESYPNFDILVENYSKENNTSILLDKFLSILKENNIFFDEESLLKQFFDANNIDFELLNVCINHIRKSFDKNTEIYVYYDPEYTRKLRFRIRVDNYEEQDILKNIFTARNLILDTLDDKEAGFNITINTDYDEPEFINESLQEETT